VAAKVLGCNQLADAYYPILASNVRGGGTHTLRFARGELPPAGAFWSLTLYDSNGHPVPNGIDRAAISSWMDLSYESDGALQIVLAPSEPKNKGERNNWLPTPADREWNLVMRLYVPSEGALQQGGWVPPLLRQKKRFFFF